MPSVALANGSLVYPGVDANVVSLGYLIKTTAADNTWQALGSGETALSPAAGSSRYSTERSTGTGRGEAGNPPPNSISHQKNAPADAVWTGKDNVPTDSAGAPGALKYVLADGVAWIWDVRPGIGSSVGFAKVTTLTGSVWTEKALSPQNYTYQIGDNTGTVTKFVFGKFENSDAFAGEVFAIVVAPGVAFSSATINGFIAAKTTASILAALAGNLNASVYDYSDGLVGDLTGNGRNRLSATGNSAGPTTIPLSAWTPGASAGGSVDDFYVSLLAGNYSKRDRGLMAGATYKLDCAYKSKAIDPLAHQIALNNPRQVKALTDNGQLAAFNAISGPVWPA